MRPLLLVGGVTFLNWRIDAVAGVSFHRVRPVEREVVQEYLPPVVFDEFWRRWRRSVHRRRQRWADQELDA